MSQVQFIQVAPGQLQSAIVDGVKTQLDELKKHLTKYLTRNEVAEMLSVDLSTVHNLSVKDTLQKYQIDGRVLYKRKEVESAIVKLEN